MLAWLNELFNSFVQALLSVLPHSPFTKYIDAIQASPYLGYVNWFFPINVFLVMTNAWLLAIGVFYAFRIIGKWIKLMD